MTIDELNQDQLFQLKQNFLCETQESVSWGELAAADEIISDDLLRENYGWITFTADDFF